jgi:hypothetical protein
MHHRFLLVFPMGLAPLGSRRHPLSRLSSRDFRSAPTAAIVLIQGNPFQPPSAVSPAPIAEALSSRGVSE